MDIDIKEYAKKLAEQYGIENSPYEGEHAIVYPDGSVEKLKESDLYTILGGESLFSFKKDSSNIYSKTIVIGKKTKVTPSNKYKKVRTKNTTSFDYKDAA